MVRRSPCFEAAVAPAGSPVGRRCFPQPGTQIVYRRFLMGSAAYFVAQLFNRALGMILIPVYGNLIPVGDYGVLSGCNTFSTLLGMTLTLGVEGAVTVFYFQMAREEFCRFLRSVWLWLLAAPLLVALLLNLAGPQFATLFFRDVPWYPYLAVTAATACLSTAQLLPLAVLRAEERAGLYALLSVGAGLASAAGILLFVVVLKWGVLGALLGQLVGSGIGALPAHWIVVRRFRGASGPLAVWEHVRSALAFGLPVLPHILAMWVLNLSGRMVLLNLHSKEAAGVYSLAFTLGMLVHLGGISLISGFGPLYYARADEPAFRAELPRLLGRYVTVHTWTALCVACLSQDVLYLFIRRNADYHAAGPLVVWIAFGYWWFVTFYQLGFTVVEAKRQTRWSAALSVPAALVNLGLNHWMIPRYGALAASISTLVAFCLMAILTLILARRLADLPFPYVRIGIGVALACGFFLLVGRWSLPQAPMVSLLTKFGLLCVFGLLLAGTQGLTPQALVRWLRSIAPGGGRRAETA